MRSVRYIDEVSISSRRVIVRVDYNVSLDKRHRIANDERIRQTIPTLKLLLKHGNTLVLISHLGRPEGKIQPDYSLAPVARDLEKLLNVPVDFVEGFSVSPRSRITLLENIRFYKGEQENDAGFASMLSTLGDVYVNDAFGVSHRNDASVVGLPALMKSSYGGLLLKKEIGHIEKLTKKPKHPFIAIIGGAKIDTKIGVIGKLLTLADEVLLGGLLAQNADKIHESHHKKLILPVDWIESKGKKLDIGPKTMEAWAPRIAKARTIVWNGPVGYIEDPRYLKGTDFLFEAIAANRRAISIIGGGDTLKAVSKKEHVRFITHVSTGGGAMLEFIENGTLPGIEALAAKT